MALVTERQKGAHLLRRFGLGASEAELDYYLQGGLKGAIDKLLDYDKVDEGFNIDVENFRNKNNQLNPISVGVWWSARFLITRRPLQEKMTLFWHDHFATSASKVNQGGALYNQNETLRANATGNFREMLMQVSKDPAMLFWLDNQYNVKGKPNENFAREVMELFTLGIGNYTEQDIKEAARAFTGWSIGRTNRAEGAGQKRPLANFAFRPNLHDDGEKTVLGKTGPLVGEDVIDHLCELPRTSYYIAFKLWEWFAYPDPSEALIQNLASEFRKSSLDIKTLLRAIMTSPEFYRDKAERAIYKNPVDFVAVTLRQLGVGQILSEMVAGLQPGEFQGRLVPALSSYGAMKQMGMQLLFPPDVAGWDSGPAWVTTATMVERISWGDKVFGRGARYNAQYSSYRLFDQDPTARGVATKLVSVLDAPIPASKMAKLTEAAQRAMGSRLTEQNANAAAAAVARLIFASPEFQFA